MSNQKPFCVVTGKGSIVKGSTLDEYAIKMAGESESRRLSVDAFEGQYKGSGLVSPPYNPDSLMRVMDINTYHSRCCKTKAVDAAGLGFDLSGNNEGLKKEIATFLKNLNIGINETLRRVMIDFEAIGWGVFELVRVGADPAGKVADINHIHASTMRMHKSGIKAQQRIGAKYVWFKVAGCGYDIDAKDGKEYKLGTLEASKRATEIVWINNYSPKSSFYGEPDFIPALGTITGDFYRREYNRKFFENFGVPTYAVFITGNYDAGEEDENGVTPLEKAIQKHFTDICNNPYKTLILSLPTRSGEPSDIEVKFEALATDMKEASFRMYRQDNRNEVIVAHGVDPYRIGVLETGSLGGSTAAENSDTYKMSIIEPRQNMIENLINRHVISSFDDSMQIEFAIAEIDTDDEAHEMEMTRELYDMGAISSAEVRAKWAMRFNIEADMPDDLITPNEIEKALKSIARRG